MSATALRAPATLRVRCDCDGLRGSRRVECRAAKMVGRSDRVVRCESGHQAPGRGSWVARSAPVYELQTSRRRRGRVSAGGEARTGSNQPYELVTRPAVWSRCVALASGERAGSRTVRRRTAENRSDFLRWSPLGRG